MGAIRSVRPIVHLFFFEGMKSCCDIDVANEILDFLNLRMGRVFGLGPVPLGAEVKAVGDTPT